MRFLTLDDPKRFNKEELNHLKEHIEVVYAQVKEYLDDSDEEFTILDESSPFVKTIFYPTIEDVVDTTSEYEGIEPEINTVVISKTDNKDDWQSRENLVFFDKVVSPLFRQFDILNIFSAHDSPTTDNFIQYHDYKEI